MTASDIVNYSIPYINQIGPILLLAGVILNAQRIIDLITYTIRRR